MDVHEEQDGHDPAAALAELRRRLADALAAARLNRTQLAARAQLGRTTVWEALSAGKPVPSAGTVAALARALKLPVPELLELQRAAATSRVQEPDTVTEGGSGRPISAWDPHDLEVHPAGPRIARGSGTPGVRALPGYVRREHDQVLADAVRDAAAGDSRMVVLVGSSSTGKTRACWEAVQPLAGKGWRLWHPFDPTPAEAALEDLHRVGPCTVVWLNEAQHYLGDRAAGERIAAAVHDLLVSPERGPVLVLGTLWPEYAHQYTALPTPGAEDPHSRVRKLLAGRTLSVPDAFTPQDLAAAAALAEHGDRLLGEALTRARTDGRMTQNLAGAPELLNRYQHASPAARAVLEAAMDARRLGVGLHLPQAFLTDAVTGYLTDTDYDQLRDDWAEAAFAELADPVHGKQAPLRRTTPRPPQYPPIPTTAVPQAPRAAGPQFRLADYLEQHGRTTRRPLCPPASFWHAAHTHLPHPDDLDNLAQAAADRYRLQWAHHLRHRAADHGSVNALHKLALMREKVGDWEGAELLVQLAAERGDTWALHRLAEMREEAGDREAAEAMARQAADHGNPDALHQLALMREKIKNAGSFAALANQAVAHGWAGNAMLKMVEMLEEDGDHRSAEALARSATRAENADALHRLAQMRKEAGDREGAERCLRQAADRGRTDAPWRLAVMREEAGDKKGAERCLRQAIHHGNTDAPWMLAVMREEAGDHEGAEALARQIADNGPTAVRRITSPTEETLLHRLWPHGLDPDGTPTPPW